MEAGSKHGGDPDGRYRRIEGEWFHSFAGSDRGLEISRT